MRSERHRTLGNRRIFVLGVGLFAGAAGVSESSPGTASPKRVQTQTQTQETKEKRSPAASVGGPEGSIDVILSLIGELEGENDPKCHATATRLENFMFGTPLSPEARTTKVELQKKLVLDVWRKASVLARRESRKSITVEDVSSAAGRLFDFEERTDGSVRISTSSGEPLELNPRDVRQYASIAYALRAILAVQQDLQLHPRDDTIAADVGSIDGLTRLLDVHTLGSLFVADRNARKASEPEISGARFSEAWTEVVGLDNSLTGDELASIDDEPTNEGATPIGDPYGLVRRIVDQKLTSYEAYNEVSMTLFWQNVKAFFARHDWPSDEREIQKLQGNFSNMVVLFLADLLKRAEAEARSHDSPVIRAEHLDSVQHLEAPFLVNDYEDVVFFPRLGTDVRVSIESYDMDAFRDSGLHWKYLAECINHPSFPGKLGLDPFAAELASEAAAQYAVLLFRMAGRQAKQASEPTLTGRHFIDASNEIHNLASKHGRVPEKADVSGFLSSTEGITKPVSGRFFREITAEQGVHFEHRSSDWLSRFQRSYLYQLDEDETEDSAAGASSLPPRAMDTPPSFSGGGVAADDINNDGWIDLVLVGGAGNRIYINESGRLREDLSANISFRRDDSNFGEPRQPILADLNNDGWQDLLITHAWDDHRIYRNLGDGRFEDQTLGAGLGGAGKVGGPATVFDFDGDGLLDIYIGYFGNYLEGVRPYLVRDNINADANRLYRNRGDWVFEDVTESSGTGDTGWAQAVAHLDIDRDGWQDLVIANDFGQNAYLRNNGDGTFEDWTEALRTDIPAHSMNVGSADLNADGYPDIYISNILTMAKDEKFVLPTAETPMRFNAENLATMRIVEANHLFVSVSSSRGLRHYASSRAIERGESSTGWAWDADFFDFDNDGDDDLYVVNGHIEYPIYDAYSYRDARSDSGTTSSVVSNFQSRESNVLFVNQNGKLENRSHESGADFADNSRGAAFLDIDRDGALDIAVNNFHSKATLLGNLTKTNGWLSVRLVGEPGRRTSRDAIGATLILTTSNGNKIWRTVQSSTGYLSSHPKDQYFGLGSNVDNVPLTLEIHWPNGDVETKSGLERNGHFLVTQGEPEPQRRQFPR